MSEPVVVCVVCNRVAFSDHTCRDSFAQDLNSIRLPFHSSFLRSVVANTVDAIVVQGLLWDSFQDLSDFVGREFQRLSFDWFSHVKLEFFHASLPFYAL